MKRAAASMVSVARLNEKTGEISCCFASSLYEVLPNASFKGFTGTPIVRVDRDRASIGKPAVPDRSLPLPQRSQPGSADVDGGGTPVSAPLCFSLLTFPVSPEHSRSERCFRPGNAAT
jgi:hypothetical protein